MTFRTFFTTCVLVIVPFSSSLPAQAADSEHSKATLEERLSRLEEKVERLLKVIEKDPQAAQSREVQEEVRALSEEKSGTVPQADLIVPPEAAPQIGEAPVAVEVIRYRGPEASEEIVNLPFSGYMEAHVNNDGISPTTFDFHRFVLLFGHGFGKRIRFWSELELEHGFVESGEVSGGLELEQAFLDLLINPKVNFRAGMLLTPVGIINERHEPPSFHGVERPFVDTLIIPTTWFGVGAGLVGDLGNGFAYKSYVMSSLDGARFSAEEGFREGRQKGFLENARNLAWTGRLEYRGVRGLNLGASVWTGETGFNFRDLNGRASIFEFDGRYRFGRFQGRGEFAITHLGDAARINRILRQRQGINPNVAEQMRGFYLEMGANLFPSRWKHDLVPFYRYENFDTQYRMPTGFLPLKQFDRSAHVLGLTYFPYPDIAFKFDYNFMGNASEVITTPNRWNLGIGWWF